MDKESLISLIAETKKKIVEFEDNVFKQKTEEYSIYRAETSIWMFLKTSNLGSDKSSSFKNTKEEWFFITFFCS